MATRSRSKAGRTRRSPKRLPHVGAAIPPQPAADQHEALAARLSQERMEAFTSALGLPNGTALDAVSGQRIKALHAVMQESYELLNTLLAGLDLDPPIACKSGCIHCCYNQIALTEPEALVLGLHLLETRDKERLRDLSDRTQALVDNLQGKSWQDIGMARHRLPCLFLENGNCSVYPARPFACRGWNSVNVDMCVQSNLTEDAMTPIENHAIMRLITESIQKGLMRGSNAQGLETGYLLMSRAVSLLLEGGPEKGLLDCTVDWLSGKPFFGRKKAW